MLCNVKSNLSLGSSTICILYLLCILLLSPTGLKNFFSMLVKKRILVVVSHYNDVISGCENSLLMFILTCYAHLRIKTSLCNACDIVYFIVCIYTIDYFLLRILLDCS